MHEIKALLFDMDGVVIDSEPIHEKAQRIVFQAHALPVPASEYPSFKGMTERKVFERIVSKYGSEGHDVDVLVAAKEDTFGSLLSGLEPIRGALDFIRRVHGAYRLALTTSSVRMHQRFAFDRFGLDPYFQVVVTAEDIEHPKPHPQPYLTTAERLGIPPARCLVIEDSVHGVRSARAAGCYVVGMTTSFAGDRLREAGAHVAVDTYDELSSHLENLASQPFGRATSVR